VSPSEPTYYEVLGVPRDADRESIRRAYIEIARASHPDRRAGGSSGAAAAEERIRAANAAWHTLRDPHRRHEYDRSLPDPLRRSPTIETPVADPFDTRPPPPSGFVVSAATAPLWRWGPVVVAVLIGAALLIGSAYATSKDPSTTALSTTTRARAFSKGDCVAITAGPSGKVAQVVPCDQPLTGVVDSVVETPRPCPSTTNAFALSDGRTTLCVLRQAGASPSGS